MSNQSEQRICIKFCANSGKTSTQTVEILTIAFGNAALKKTQIFEWYKRFCEGRDRTEDGAMSGRPASARTCS